MIYLVRYALIVLYTMFWGILACTAGLIDRSGETIVWIGRQWVRWCMASCGVRVRCEGLEQLDPTRPFVVMSNHQSVFDIAALISTLPMSWRFVAKRELTRIPLFGWALAVGGHVIIDRSDRDTSVRSLHRAAERVRSGLSVIIFPEGTRSQSGELGPFKSGGFHLAIEAGVPVLPVSISGSHHITPKRSLKIHSGPILIRYGKPIPTAELGDEDSDALKAEVRRAIVAGLDPELQQPVAPRS